MLVEQVTTAAGHRKLSAPPVLRTLQQQKLSPAGTKRTAVTAGAQQAAADRVLHAPAAPCAQVLPQASSDQPDRHLHAVLALLPVPQRLGQMPGHMRLQCRQPVHLPVGLRTGHVLRDCAEQQPTHLPGTQPFLAHTLRPQHQGAVRSSLAAARSLPGSASRASAERGIQYVRQSVSCVVRACMYACSFASAACQTGTQCTGRVPPRARQLPWALRGSQQTTHSHNRHMCS